MRRRKREHSEAREEGAQSGERRGSTVRQRKREHSEAGDEGAQ